MYLDKLKLKSQNYCDTIYYHKPVNINNSKRYIGTSVVDKFYLYSCLHSYYKW